MGEKQSTAGRPKKDQFVLWEKAREGGRRKGYQDKIREKTLQRDIVRQNKGMGRRVEGSTPRKSRSCRLKTVGKRRYWEKTHTKSEKGTRKSKREAQEKQWHPCTKAVEHKTAKRNRRVDKKREGKKLGQKRAGSPKQKN